MSVQNGHKVAIGLGSNLNRPHEQLDQACLTIQALADCRWLCCSDYRVSAPQGPQDQPDFVNAVCLIETALSPTALLQQLQAIEQKQGRVKKRHWGERNIDLDILLYGDVSLDTEQLQIPHPYMTQRDFVLLPLLQVWPEARLPSGEALASFIQNLDERFIQ